MAQPPVDDDPPWWQSRRIIRAARVGSLASSIDGQPFASLVTPACAPDLSLLMLLSSLSEHTRHLRADPRCAILFTSPAETINPQTAPRVTVTGIAEPYPDAALKARWLAIHPYAALYADFGDFALWRVRPVAALFVGGFARATRLKARELLPEAGASLAVGAAEAEIVAHCNADHPDTMAVLGAAASGRQGAWRMVAADLDGADLALDEQVTRVSWRAPVADANGLRSELIRLARVARNT